MDLSTVLYVLGAVVYGLWRNRSKAVEAKPQTKPVWIPPPPTEVFPYPSPPQPAPTAKPQSLTKASSKPKAKTKEAPAHSPAPKQPYRPLSQEDWRKVVIGSVLLEPRFDRPYQGPAQERP
ncbi:MAG: hypothetical protein ACO31H_06455 [Bacteroidia bacterium]|jgi:hypothetical protein